MPDVDIPDEVADAACYEAKLTGQWPQWFLDLRRGTHKGAVPGRPKAPARRKMWEAMCRARLGL